MDYRLYDYCQRLPKVELHAHLNGSLSQNTLKKLCNIKNAVFSSQEIDKIMQDKFSSLSECFKIFDIAHKLTNTPEAVFIATCDVIKEFYEDNVIYLELRSTPRNEKSQQGLMTKTEYLETIIKALKRCKSEIPQILVKLLVSIDRKQGYLSAKENVEIAIQFKEKYPEYVVGIDVSGDPSSEWQYDNTKKSVLEILELARKADLKIAVHCAEIPNEMEVVDILKFKPDRLGHCTCIHPTLQGSQELFDMLLESKIPVELCLTSNIKCKTVSLYTCHHFIHLYKAGHPVTIGTDDKGVFNTCLSKEYLILHSVFNFESKALKSISALSVQYSFASTEEKKYLSSIIENFNDCDETLNE